MNRASTTLVLMVTSCLTATTALAEDPLGFYVGAGIGESDVRSQDDTAFNYYDLTFHQNDVAWNGVVGVRPLSMLGLELTYIDFGVAKAPPPPSTIFGYFADNSKQSATALFAIGYLPLPMPFLDIYGKLGVARLHTDAQVSDEPPTCPVVAILACERPYTVRQNQWSTDLAYGAGAQAKFGAIAVRAEYERISASGGNPDIFSSGVTWSF
jgi:opacity protein-like surface antigen